MSARPSLPRRALRRLLRPLLAPLVARKAAELQAETDGLRVQVQELESKMGRLVGELERLTDLLAEEGGGE